MANSQQEPKIFDFPGAHVEIFENDATVPDRTVRIYTSGDVKGLDSLLAAARKGLANSNASVTAHSADELSDLDAFLKSKPAPGTLFKPTKEVFVDWRQDGQALMMFGILPRMLGWVESYDLNALMVKQGIKLMGRRYVRPDEEDGKLINQHQKKRSMKSRLAGTKFEDAVRSFWLSIPVDLSGARVQDLTKRKQYNSHIDKPYNNCAVRRVAPQP